MKIRELLKKRPLLILPPMAGYTEAACRILAREFGADLTFTEMVSAKGLHYKNENTRSLLTASPLEDALGVQLFGSDPDIIAEAVASPELARFDIIDLNCGCPVNKIVKNGEGSALLKSPELIFSVVKKAVAAAGGKPISVKLRLGFEHDSFLALDAALAAETAGASLITVHGRRREDFYSGTVDLAGIARVREAVRVPFVANGDIVDRASFLHAMRETNADGAAIGRGALGKFFVFAEILEKPVEYRRHDVFARHIALLREYYPEWESLNFVKKHSVYYLKGVENSRRFLVELLSAKSLSEVESMRFPR